MKKIAQSIRDFAKDNWLSQILPYSKTLLYVCTMLRILDLFFNLEVIGSLAIIVFYIAAVGCIANELWMDEGIAFSIVAIGHFLRIFYTIIRVIISGWPIIDILEFLVGAIAYFYFGYQFLKLAKSTNTNK